ncbi:MAG: HDOD domain-containing protein, partial [Bacteroidota bacterium]
EQDPAVVARLLRVANSALYARSRRISDVQRAVVTLGPTSVIGIVMSYQFVEMKSELDDVTTLPFLNIVRHSIATAFLARHLVQRTPSFPSLDVSLNERAGEAYTAGLMHDFGKVVLLYNSPEDAAMYYSTPAESAEDAAAIDHEAQEQTLFGHTHASVGSFLLSKLTFPQRLQDVIAQHHAEGDEAPQDRSDQHLVAVLQAANLAAHGLGYGTIPHEDWEGCQADPTWERLATTTPIGYGTAEALTETVASAQEDLALYIGAML